MIARLLELKSRPSDHRLPALHSSTCPTAGICQLQALHPAGCQALGPNLHAVGTAGRRPDVQRAEHQSRRCILFGRCCCIHFCACPAGEPRLHMPIRCARCLAGMRRSKQANLPAVDWRRWRQGSRGATHLWLCTRAWWTHSLHGTTSRQAGGLCCWSTSACISHAAASLRKCSTTIYGPVPGTRRSRLARYAPGCMQGTAPRLLRPLTDPFFERFFCPRLLRRCVRLACAGANLPGCR